MCFLPVLSFASVFSRIVEAFDVIDAQPRYLALLHYVQNQLVDMMKNVPLFDLNRYELVDMEEPAIVDLLGGEFPESKPKPLLHEQPVQGLPF